MSPFFLPYVMCLLRACAFSSLFALHGAMAYRQNYQALSLFDRMHTTYAHQQKGLVSIMQYVWADARRKLLSLSAKVYENLLWDNPYNGIPAVVRMTSTDEICDGEQLAIGRRMDRVLRALRVVLLTHEIPTVPRVALCCSGGGFRAMLATGGFLEGLDERGLLDCIAYMAGVSGSTWLMGPWIASGKSIQVYMRCLQGRLSHGLAYQFTASQARSILRQLLVKLLYNQPISSIDLYGPLLANTLLLDKDDNRLCSTITETHQATLAGIYPFPLYTAIATNQQPYEWFEISPLEIGSPYTRAYIPTWACGRHFSNGISENCAPEQTLGYYMGVCGSAFEVNTEDILTITAGKIEHALQTMPLAIADAIQGALHRFAREYVGRFRLFPSLLPNSTYQMHTKATWRDHEHLALIDAGIDGNLPFAPLLRPARAIDLIIVLDVSQEITRAPELQRAQAYAQRHNLLWPSTDYSVIHGSSDAYLFRQNEIPGCPSILYIPLARNARYSETFDPAVCTEHAHCNTLNFAYTAAQAEELAGLARFIAHEYAETIIDELARLSGCTHRGS